MKAKNQQNFGTQTTQTIDYRGTSESSLQVSTGSNVVVHAGLVAGDHKKPNPWSYDIEDITDWNGNVRDVVGVGEWWETTYVSTGATSHGLAGPVELWNRDLAYNQALSKAYDKMRGTIDLSTTLAQWSQTSRMLNDRLNPRNLTKIGYQLQRMLAYRKRKQRNANKGVDYSDDSQATWKDGFTVPADLWLEFNYGWKPLVSDVWGALDQTTKSLQDTKFDVRAKVKMPAEKSVTSPRGEVQAVARGHGFHSCNLIIGIKTQIEDDAIARYSSINPVSIAWELMPYSFVVDWFIDVGSYMRTMESALLYRNAITSVTISELYIHEYQYMAKGEGANGGNSYNIDLTGNRNIKRFNRSVGSLSLFPRAPQFRAELGASRLFSAASLLAQFLKK